MILNVLHFSLRQVLFWFVAGIGFPRLLVDGYNAGDHGKQYKLSSFIVTVTAKGIMCCLLSCCKALIQIFYNNWALERHMTADRDTLSGNPIADLFMREWSFCCLFINGCGHRQLLVISAQWTELQFHKVMQRRTELLFSWTYITMSPPKLRGNGENGESFQLILMDSPGPVGLRGPQSSDILQLIWFSRCKIP